jgi:predicted dehydrogenase
MTPDWQQTNLQSAICNFYGKVTMASNQRLRVAIVGSGIGAEHARAFMRLPEQFELLAVCDVDTNRARALATAHGVQRVVGDIAELCRMDDLDVIDICTPPQAHFAHIQQTLAAGKHAICEKPLVGSLAAVDQLIAAEAESERQIMPIFQYRFGHGLQKLKALVDAGLAGRAYLATIEVAWRRRAEYYAVPWRRTWKEALGGTLLNHAIHTLDMLCYVAGPVKNVFARATTRVNPVEVEDCAAVSLEMADGSLATLAVTLGSAEQITRHRFCFEHFTAESNTQPYRNSSDPWTFTGDTPEAAARIETALARFEPLPEGFEGQFYRFHTALRDGTPLPVTLADARAALELLTAMYMSARSGQAVALPLDREHPAYTGWAP